MMMRIGIDGYNLAIPNGTGIATYGFMLAAMLRNMGVGVDGIFGIDAGRETALHELLFYDRLGRPQPLTKRQRRWRKVDPRRLLSCAHAHQIRTSLVDRKPLEERLPAFDRLFTSPGLFERARAYFKITGRFLTLKVADPPAIMHWTYPVPVKLAGARNIYTLHDLVPLRLPYTTADQKQYYHKLVSACMREADQICTVSEASRADILAHFPCDPARVTNTYQISAMPNDLLDEDPEISARIVEGAFGLKPNRYWLYFGAIEPKKNVGRLLEAYLSLDTDTPLVVVGGRAWEADTELALLSRCSGDRVRRLEYLPRRTLLRLVRHARAVTFPSIYEGFGLPVHEAMLLGTPVLTSTAGALAEIAGDAALTVDPYSSQAIAEGLRELDQNVALRADLSARGRVHAERFSEDHYRVRLDRLYAGLLEQDTTRSDDLARRLSISERGRQPGWI